MKVLTFLFSRWCLKSEPKTCNCQQKINVLKESFKSYSFQVTLLFFMGLTHVFEMFGVGRLVI